MDVRLTHVFIVLAVGLAVWYSYPAGKVNVPMHEIDVLIEGKIRIVKPYDVTLQELDGWVQPPIITCPPHVDCDDQVGHFRIRYSFEFQLIQLSVFDNGNELRKCYKMNYLKNRKFICVVCFSI